MAFFNNSIAQSENSCSRKGHVAFLTSGTNNRITYYQYPSMNKYDIKYLKLDLNVEAANLFISGSCLTKIKTVAAMDTFIIELVNGMNIDSVLVNGSNKSFTHTADHIFVPFSSPIASGTNLNILVYYNGTTSSNAVYAGTFQNNGLSYTASLSESYQAREWFPAKQILSDKIDSADIWITTSSTNKAGTNGLLQGVDELPTGKVRYRWKSRHPMNYYMPSFAVGNYSE